MGDTPPIDIQPGEWAAVMAILKRHVPDDEVFPFGSRARRQTKPFSDLDLVICGRQAIPLSTIASLEHDFVESDLPFRVDVVDWHRIGEGFRRAIAADQVPVQRQP